MRTEIVGMVTFEQLARLQRAGVSGDVAAQAIIDEAKKLYPGAFIQLIQIESERKFEVRASWIEPVKIAR